jgi:hypothetical protein
MYETHMKHVEVECKILLWMEIFHLVYMCFIHVLDTRVTTFMSKLYKPIKNQNLYDYYCQIMIPRKFVMEGKQFK